MTLNGLIAFTLYILNIYFRWARITFRRYGIRGILDVSYRPKRAGVGTGRRIKPGERGHSNEVGGVAVWYPLRQLELERMAVA